MHTMQHVVNLDGRLVDIGSCLHQYVHYISVTLLTGSIECISTSLCSIHTCNNQAVLVELMVILTVKVATLF